MSRPNASPRKWARKIEAARSAAQDERFKIGHAAALLLMLGEHIDEVPGQDLGCRVDYLACQIDRHAEALAEELEKIEHAAMALGRGHEAEPDPPAAADADNVVRLSRPDGDAA